LVCGADERISGDIITTLPSPLLPIIIREVIGKKNIEVRLQDACRFQSIQAARDQCLGDPAPAILFLDDHVLKISTSTVVTTHRAADDSVLFGDKAEPGIPN
jgi:hypothetical protein